MVNPGTFKSARFTFLMEQKELYNAAVKGNEVAACLADIQRHYFKRFPIDAPHNVDPNPAWLAAVNDDKAGPEVSPPNMDQMSHEECDEAVKAWAVRCGLLRARKDVCICVFTIGIC